MIRVAGINHVGLGGASCMPTLCLHTLPAHSASHSPRARGAAPRTACDPMMLINRYLKDRTKIHLRFDLAFGYILGRWADGKSKGERQFHTALETRPLSLREMISSECTTVCSNYSTLLLRYITMSLQIHAVTVLFYYTGSER